MKLFTLFLYYMGAFLAPVSPVRIFSNKLGHNSHNFGNKYHQYTPTQIVYSRCFLASTSTQWHYEKQKFHHPILPFNLNMIFSIFINFLRRKRKKSPITTGNLLYKIICVSNLLNVPKPLDSQLPVRTQGLYNTKKPLP